MKGLILSFFLCIGFFRSVSAGAGAGAGAGEKEVGEQCSSDADCDEHAACIQANLNEMSSPPFGGLTPSWLKESMDRYEALPYVDIKKEGGIASELSPSAVEFYRDYFGGDFGIFTSALYPPPIILRYYRDFGADSEQGGYYSLLKKDCGAEGGRAQKEVCEASKLSILSAVLKDLDVYYDIKGSTVGASCAHHEECSSLRCEVPSGVYTGEKKCVKHYTMCSCTPAGEKTPPGIPCCQHHGSIKVFQGPDNTCVTSIYGLPEDPFADDDYRFEVDYDASKPNEPHSCQIYTVPSKEKLAPKLGMPINEKSPLEKTILVRGHLVLMALEWLFQNPKKRTCLKVGGKRISDLMNDDFAKKLKSTRTQANVAYHAYIKNLEDQIKRKEDVEKLIEDNGELNDQIETRMGRYDSKADSERNAQEILADYYSGAEYYNLLIEQQKSAIAFEETILFNDAVGVPDKGGLLTVAGLTDLRRAAQSGMTLKEIIEGHFDTSRLGHYWRCPVETRGLHDRISDWLWHGHRAEGKHAMQYFFHISKNPNSAWEGFKELVFGGGKYWVDPPLPNDLSWKKLGNPDAFHSHFKLNTTEEWIEREYTKGMKKYFNLQDGQRSDNYYLRIKSKDEPDLANVNDLDQLSKYIFDLAKVYSFRNKRSEHYVEGRRTFLKHVQNVLKEVVYYYSQVYQARGRHIACLENIVEKINKVCQENPDHPDCGKTVPCDPEKDEECKTNNPPDCDPEDEECKTNNPPGCDPEKDEECKTNNPPGCDPEDEECKTNNPPGCDPEKDEECKTNNPPGCDPEKDEECKTNNPPGCDPEKDEECKTNNPPGCDPEKDGECNPGAPTTRTSRPPCDPENEDCREGISEDPIIPGGNGPPTTTSDGSGSPNNNPSGGDESGPTDRSTITFGGGGAGGGGAGGGTSQSGPAATAGENPETGTATNSQTGKVSTTRTKRLKDFYDLLNKDRKKREEILKKLKGKKYPENNFLGDHANLGKILNKNHGASSSSRGTSASGIKTGNKSQSEGDQATIPVHGAPASQKGTKFSWKGSYGSPYAYGKRSAGAGTAAGRGVLSDSDRQKALSRRGASRGGESDGLTLFEKVNRAYIIYGFPVLLISTQEKAAPEFLENIK